VNDALYLKNKKNEINSVIERLLKHETIDEK